MHKIGRDVSDGFVAQSAPGVHAGQRGKKEGWRKAEELHSFRGAGVGLAQMRIGEKGEGIVAGREISLMLCRERKGREGEGRSSYLHVADSAEGSFSL